MTPKTECEIVGALDASRCIALADLRSVLAGPQQALAHNTEFTGRPTTRIFADDNFVAKLHQEGDLTPEQAREKAAECLEREREYAVHIASKTWFVVAEDGRGFVGNITPRLVPLQAAEASVDWARFLQHLKEVMRIYVSFAGQFKLRLDEGLSNFAEDAQGRLYYVDDDFYGWDDFEHLGQFIGVTLRKIPELSAAHARALGDVTCKAINESFGSADGCRKLAGILRSSFFATDEQKALAEAFIKGLTPPRKSRRATKAAQPAAAFEIGAEPIALIADIHANLPALERVSEEIRSRGIGQTLVLGDVVGYGPHPRECIAFIREAGYTVLKGNHDHVAATGEPTLGFGVTARSAIEWTLTVLSQDERQWLGNLPLQLRGDDWMAQHGAPMDPAHFNAYVYTLTYEDNLQYMEDNGLRLAFYGHTHIPNVYFTAKGAAQLSEARKQALGEYDRAMICPGSVGQPRRGVVGAEMAVFDPKANTIEFLSLAYDATQTIEDMVKFELPEQLVRRLKVGE